MNSSRRANQARLFAKLLLPAVAQCGGRYGRAQATLDEARVACALERYHLAHGNYPEQLDALAPKFLTEVPTDVITRRPLVYRRTSDGRFLLYSVGWNQRDDGGVPGMTTGKRPRFNSSAGDWVWKY